MFESSMSVDANMSDALPPAAANVVAGAGLRGRVHNPLVSTQGGGHTFSGMDVQRLGKPDVFTGDTVQWPFYYFNMRAYIGAMDLFSADQLSEVEQRSEPIQLTQLTGDWLRRAAIFFFILAMSLKGGPHALIQRCEPNNGLEAWRLLTRRYQCADDGSSLGQLQAIMDFDFGNGTKYLDKLSDWQLLVKTYNDHNPLEEVSESVLKAVLVRGAPEPLKAHLEIVGHQLSYLGVLNSAEAFVRARQAWHPSGLGKTTTALEEAKPMEPADMEVDAMYKGKAKGKGKGKSKGKLDQKFGGVCYGCGEAGHRSADCPYSWWDSSECWLCGGWGHLASECANRRHGDTVWQLGSPPTFPEDLESTQATAEILDLAEAVPAPDDDDITAVPADHIPDAVAETSDSTTFFPSDLVPDPAWMFALTDDING